eukprot:NODE_16834_length_975_cov_1.790094.p1 GENE.NODE_16834_length_975_cov_1.790094~~NODE_16834_length_975_cov_1.790094.p1  ORF type:complete len:203 (+),score=61.64 NODE_16834_length_975_cov_1.790094:270-878(+)
MGAPAPATRGVRTPLNMRPGGVLAMATEAAEAFAESGHGHGNNVSRGLHGPGAADPDTISQLESLITANHEAPRSQPVPVSAGRAYRSGGGAPGIAVSAMAHTVADAFMEIGVEGGHNEHGAIGERAGTRSREAGDAFTVAPPQQHQYLHAEHMGGGMGPVERGQRRRAAALVASQALEVAENAHGSRRSTALSSPEPTRPY